ncbi:hypothetical protein Landi51_00616 [Colletotrichum acutatum]
MQCANVANIRKSPSPAVPVLLGTQQPAWHKLQLQLAANRRRGNQRPGLAFHLKFQSLLPASRRPPPVFSTFAVSRPPPTTCHNLPKHVPGLELELDMCCPKTPNRTDDKTRSATTATAPNQDRHPASHYSAVTIEDNRTPSTTYVAREVATSRARRAFVIPIPPLCFSGFKSMLLQAPTFAVRHTRPSFPLASDFAEQDAAAWEACVEEAEQWFSLKLDCLSSFKQAVNHDCPFRSRTSIPSVSTSCGLSVSRERDCAATHGNSGTAPQTQSDSIFHLILDPQKP